LLSYVVQPWSACLLLSLQLRPDYTCVMLWSIVVSAAVPLPAAVRLWPLPCCRASHLLSRGCAKTILSCLSADVPCHSIMNQCTWAPHCRFSFQT
jgi:hypothetical protein